MAQNITVNPFQKADLVESKLRLAITGTAGSGKTWSALNLATKITEELGVDTNIFLIDTEHGSAAKYSGQFDFQTISMGPDSGNAWNTFHPRNLFELMDAAAEYGANVLIIDSLSHFWSGTGGVLSIVEDEKSRKGGKKGFAAWSVGTEWQNQLVEKIISAPYHVICTMRSKTEYVQEHGKVTKLGMASVQREGMDFEFDVVLAMNSNHDASIDKTRCSELSGRPLWKKPGTEVAALLAQWIKGHVDTYLYGDGTTAPTNPATRRLFGQYVTEVGKQPDNAEALKSWYAEQKAKDAAQSE